MELALQSMLELNAFDADRRKTTEQIVELAEPAGNAESYKRTMAELFRARLIERERGLVITHISDQGDYTLRPAGREA